MLQQIVKDLYNKYNEYGYFVTGYDQAPHYCKTSAEWDKWNIVSNPALFETLKGGSCWDYCIAQSDFFKKNGIPHWNYCIICEQTPEEKERQGTPTTHTFTIFRGTEPDEFYYFEQSWKEQKGIYGPYPTLNDALYSTLKYMIKHNPNGVRTLSLYKHNPLNINTYGMCSWDYCDYMRSELPLWHLGEPLKNLLNMIVD